MLHFSLCLIWPGSTAVTRNSKTLKMAKYHWTDVFRQSYISQAQKLAGGKCHLTPQVLWDLRNGLFSLIGGLKANRHGIFKIQYMSYKDTVQAMEKKAWVISLFNFSLSVAFTVHYPTWRWTEDSSECNGQRWILETSTVCISHQITSYSRLNIFIEGKKLVFFSNGLSVGCFVWQRKGLKVRYK